jgi:N-acetylneuraminic acid mutarotase
MKAGEAVLLVFLIALSLCEASIQPVGAAENCWTSKAVMPVALCPEAAVVNGKIYVITDCYNYEYDPATNAWTGKTPLPTRRGGFGIATYQNKIYAIGGQRNYENLGANEAYDPTTDTWETKASMPTKRAYLDANIVNGKIYLIGGAHYTPIVSRWMQEYDANEVYDPETDSWTTETPLPARTGDYASATIDNKIYIMAGGGAPSRLNQIYDTEADTWTIGAPLPTAIRFAGAAATTGVAAPRRIYVIGGYSKSEDYSSLNQIYDPVKDTWSLGAPMPTGREALAVAVVNDTLYAIGGFRGFTAPPTGVTRTVEQYTPFGIGSSTHAPLPAVWVIAGMAVAVASVAAAVMVYSKRAKKTTDKVEQARKGTNSPS